MYSTCMFACMCECASYTCSNSTVPDKTCLVAFPCLELATSQLVIVGLNSRRLLSSVSAIEAHVHVHVHVPYIHSMSCRSCAMACGQRCHCLAS